MVNRFLYLVLYHGCLSIFILFYLIYLFFLFLYIGGHSLVSGEVRTLNLLLWFRFVAYLTNPNLLDV